MRAFAFSLLSWVATANLITAHTPAVPVREQTDTTTSIVSWRVSLEEPLKGIRSVGALVVGLGEEGRRCGVTEESLKLAVVRPFLDAGLRVSDNDLLTSPTVQVTSMFLTPNDGCVGSLFVSLTDRTLVAPNYQQGGLGSLALLGPGDRVKSTSYNAVHDVRVTHADVSLLEDGMILSGPRAGFSDRVSDSLRRIVDKFVTKIRLANQ